MIDGSTPVWQLNVFQLTELIQSIIAVPTEAKKVVDDPYLNSKEAKEYLKVSKSTLVLWKTRNYLKSEKFGGVLRFRKSELDKVLNQEA
jgi:excisionase family DNA binding protein